MRPEVVDFLDDFLAHAVPYDPVKRREQYLRTRRLKGRNAGTTDSPSGTRSSGANGSPGRSNVGNSNADMRLSRRATLEAEQKELLARLDRLRAELRVAVAKAKGRSSSAEKPDGKEDASSSTKETKSKSSKTSKDSKSTKSEPLTEKQKADKRKASKEQYEKEKKMSLSKTVEDLREQVKEYRVKIEKALSEARERNSANQSETALKGR